MSPATNRPLARPLRKADRWFRAGGIVTLALLAVTLGSLLADVGRWQAPFALAHLAALIALLPLGVLLAARALVEAHPGARSWLAAAGAVVRRHPVVSALVLAALASVAVSLANFPDGQRAVRTAANLATVAIVVALVAHYLRTARSP